MRKRSCFSCVLIAAALTLGVLYWLWSSSVADGGALPFGKGKVAVETANGERHEFEVEIATTSLQQAYGLMFRESLPEDSGMLFVFENERNVSFWMKNTLISLDMLFINADGTIARIEENAVPLNERGITSGVLVKSVLEINGGLSSKLGIKAGDRVSIINNRRSDDGGSEYFPSTNYGQRFQKILRRALAENCPAGYAGSI